MTATLALYALAGLAGGIAWLALLRVNVALLVGGRAAGGVALHLARFGLAGLGLWAAARQGGGPLLAVAGGWMAAHAGLWLRERRR